MSEKKTDGRIEALEERVRAIEERFAPAVPQSAQVSPPVVKAPHELYVPDDGDGA